MNTPCRLNNFSYCTIHWFLNTCLLLVLELPFHQDKNNRIHTRHNPALQGTHQYRLHSLSCRLVLRLGLGCFSHTTIDMNCMKNTQMWFLRNIPLFYHSYILVQVCLLQVAPNCTCHHLQKVYSHRGNIVDLQWYSMFLYSYRPHSLRMCIRRRRICQSYNLKDKCPAHTRKAVALLLYTLLLYHNFLRMFGCML